MRSGKLLKCAVLAAAMQVSVVSGALAQQDHGLLPGASSELRRDGVTTCSARNALGTKQCTTTCQPGQSADCVDGDEGADPVCECSGG